MTPVMMINGTAVPLGGEALSAGEGICIEDGTVQVTTPVKGLTQAEYDKLSAADKQADKLYVITDANTALHDQGEVYSTQETRIGTWIDGKPLYRKVLETRSLSGSGVIGTIGDDKTPVRLECYITDAQNDWSAADQVGIMWIGKNGNVSYNPNGANRQNRPMILILEYTKTNDQGVSE